ncbi:ATP synthase epsilon chain [Phycisphaerae bacterium RAS1]|nr:ATP synthase epsilon chain [Phycisphaerae bacterium RAS1]
MAKTKSLQFVVITPEQQVLEESTESLVIPAHDGEIGILADHAPLMCELGAGELRYKSGGRTNRLIIDGGFAQVQRNQVTVLTSSAVAPESVTSAMIAAAEKKCDELRGGGPDAAAARGRARRRSALLRAARRTH